jgi:hypothetical protein
VWFEEIDASLPGGLPATKTLVLMVGELEHLHVAVAVPGGEDRPLIERMTSRPPPDTM